MHTLVPTFGARRKLPSSSSCFFFFFCFAVKFRVNGDRAQKRKEGEQLYTIDKKQYIAK